MLLGCCCFVLLREHKELAKHENCLLKYFSCKIACEKGSKKRESEKLKKMKKVAAKGTRERRRRPCQMWWEKGMQMRIHEISTIMLIFDM